MARYTYPDARSSVAQQAAEWLVLLSVDDAEDRARHLRLFQRWCEKDSRHAAAAAKMQGFLDQLHAVRGVLPAPVVGDSVRAGLSAGSKPRRSGWQTVCILLCMCAPLWWITQRVPPSIYLADHHNLAGSQSQHVLADGSVLNLRGTTAVDMDFSTTQRTLHLRRGEILVVVAKDAARPFVVETPFGQVQALGTRFMLHQDENRTVLTMLESKVRVVSKVSGQQLVVTPGQQLQLDETGLRQLPTVAAGLQEQAWRSRRLLASDQPLNEVLATLARHRLGVLRYDEQALAGMRVSAVLPLDDTDEALRLLQASFPALQVHQTAGLVTWVAIKK